MPINLRRRVKEGLGHCLRYAETLSHVILRKNRCGILVYHSPSPQTLDRHLTHLKRVYTFITLDELCLQMTAAGTGGSPGPRLVVTIDDGHAANHALLEVFRKHAVRPTIYICSSIVGTRRMYWWQHPGAEAFGIEALKRLPNKERLRRLDEAGFRPEAEWPVRKALSLEQLRDLQSVADFQSHTRLHPILNKCDDDECRDEIVESKREVEALTKRPCEHFAFPNGNYDDRAIRILKEAGYRSARTADLGWNDQTTDIFRLRSILIADDASLSWLDAQLSHVPNLLKYAMRGSFNGRFPQF